MVEIRNVELWICPYCKSEYTEEIAAEDCAKDCAPVDDLLEDERTDFFCEMCKQEHKDYDDAELCETKHTESQDRHYQAWHHEEEMKKLAKAAAHPAQMKLTEGTLQ